MRPFVASMLMFLLLLTQALLAQKPDRSAPPVLGPPPILHIGDIQHLKLGNGLAVILYEKHNLPLLQITLVVRAGAVNDPDGKPGLASMTAAMMMEGAGSRSSLQLDDAVDYLGAELNVNAEQHTMSVALNTLTARLDSALSIMADVAMRPTFPAAELVRKQKERLTSLLQWRDQPPRLASVLFNQKLFPGHPYGRPAIGTAASIMGLTSEDLRSFHAANLGPNVSTLIVVGDVTAKMLLPKLEAAFGKWKPIKTTPLKLPVVPQVSEMRVFLVDKPGAPQSEIRIGRIGVSRMTEDFYSLVVMNTILGGSFSSRLNQNLREKHGYTYGATSWFDFRPEPGPFLASAAVQTQVTDSSLVEFFRELRGIRDPLSRKEFDRGRNYVALGYPSDFQTVSQIAAHLEDLVIYGLPDEYFNTYIDRILGVTELQAQQVAQKYIDPAKLLVVVVGDRAVIESRIAALNIGPITVLTVDDVLGAAPALDGK